MRNLLLLALTPLLAACPALDTLEGKTSPYKTAHEARAAVLVAEPVVVAVVVIEPEPEPPAPEIVGPDPTPEPECVPVFRVTTCE